MKNSRPEEGVYGGTRFHSPLRAAQRGPRWNRLWSLHFWSSRRLARHWPRWQIARGTRGGAALRFRRSAAIRGPAKSKILWAAQQPSALLGRAASAAFDGGSPCVGRPESIKSKGPPQNRRFCGLHSSPRPFWAAPRVRRSTEEARVPGDRSLSNQRGPRKIEDFVGQKNKKRPRGARPFPVRGLRAPAPCGSCRRCTCP